MNDMNQTLTAAIKGADLRTRAILVSLSIHSWNGARIDAKVTQEIHEAHRAKRRAGSYRKQLIDPAAFRGIKAQEAEIRAYHYKMTAPWMMGGARILPIQTLDEYREAMTRKFDAFEREVDVFVDLWFTHIATAQMNLGGMFSYSEYPSKDAVRERFWIERSFVPLPDEDDFRIGVSPEVVEELCAQMRADVDNNMRAIARDCAERLSGVVERMAERLAAYQPATKTSKAAGIFRDSIVENVREMVAILPALNIMGDAQLAQMIDRAEAALCQHEAEDLRASDDLRDEVAAEAQQIMEDLAAFMGA